MAADFVPASSAWGNTPSPFEGLEVDGRGSSTAAEIEELRQELARRKVIFISVEAQLRLLELCMDSDANYRRVGPSLDEQQAVKAKNKALKAEIVSEREQQAKLRRQLADAKRDLAARRATNERESNDLDRLNEEEDVAQAELRAQGMVMGDANSLAQEANALGLKAEDDARTAAAIMEEGLTTELSSRKQAEEAEYAQLLRVQRQLANSRQDLERLEAREHERIEALEQLAKRESELGLPDVRFNSAAGTITISGGGLGSDGRAGTPRVELRTVRIAHDEEGRLTRAEPHPSLDLWREALAAVEEDDLAKLVTRVCERLRSLPSSLGGA